MRGKENNFAYIDGANLHKGIAGFGWKLDYARFNVRSFFEKPQNKKAPDADGTA